MKRLVLVVFAALSVIVWQALAPSSSVAQVDVRGGGDQTSDGLSVLALTSTDESTDEVGLSEEELQDLSLMAEQNGLSLQDAIDRYAWNDAFAQTVSQIRAAAPEAFSGAEIMGANNAWVAFTGDAPAEALAAVAAFTEEHRNVLVDVRNGTGISEADLEIAIEAAHYAVLEGRGVANATTSLDDGARRITSLVVLESDGPEETLNELRAAAVSAVVEAGVGHILDTLKVTVVRSAVPVLGGEDANNEHFGGELVNPGCTSGFVVANEAGTRGVTTAGHCDNALSDDGAALNFRGQHIGNHGDVQWHSGPQPRPPSFYAGNANATEVNRRDVTAVNAPVVGQSLCKNGRTNHAQCQEVRRLAVCNGAACNLVQMGARLSAGGDSGGPVYWGTTAYGLHQGWHYDPSWPFDRDLFSRADRLPDALGVAVVK